MIKIYLAGPEVFLENAVEMGEMKRKLCELYGFEGLYPLDNHVCFDGKTPQQCGMEIAFGNEKLIEQADMVIANMTPFRSASCDVGTAYEMGLARGMGKPVFAYTNDNRLFLQRNLTSLEGCSGDGKQHYKDGNGMTIENFGLVDNLMLDHAVEEGIIIHNLVEEDALYSELLGFEQCLKQIRAHLEAKAA